MTNVDEIKIILSRVVLELRTQKGLTQEKLAELLDISPHTVNRIETGKAFVSGELLAKLCDVFNVAPNVLFTPKPHILLDEHVDYQKKIIKQLPGLKVDRLKDIYNLAVLSNN